MPELYGKVIGKVYHIKDGDGSNKETGETWIWRMWSFYIGDDKFTYFTSGKKPEPFEGMKVGYLTYKEEDSVSKKDGKTYTNRTIDKFEVSQESPEAPQTRADAPDSIGTHQAPIPTPKRDYHAENLGKCKFGFLKEAFVPWIKNEIKPLEGLAGLEEEAEQFATMSMRILTPKPMDTFKDATDMPDDAKALDLEDAQLPPLDSYEEDIPH